MGESLRFSVDEDTYFAEIQKLIDGLWQPASFETGPNSLWVGKRVGLTGIGDNLGAEDSDGTFSFHGYSYFDGNESTSDAKMPKVYDFLAGQVFQPDDSGSWIGTTYELIAPSTAHTLVSKGYIKTSTVAATQPIRIQTWEGINDTGFLVFDQYYPASQFPALSEVEVEYDGFLEFDEGLYYFTRYSSAANFSIKTNAGGTFPWVKIDTASIREENMLQTMGWESGYNFTDGQLLIDNRNIYIGLEAGVQTGTWESNSDKWSTIQNYADYESLLARNVQSTGLISGGVIVKASATTLNISSGTGYVTDYSDPGDPIVTSIIYAGVTGYTPTNLDSNGTFIIGIDSTGTLLELPSGLSSQEKRDNILLGIYIAKGGSILTTVDAPFNLGYDGIATAKDFITGVIGPANIEGNIIAANGTNLNIDNSGGRIFIVAANFRNDPEVADEITIPSGTNISFMQIYRQAAPSNQLDNTGAPSNYIDPDRWDDGDGTLGTVPVNKYTVQVLYIAPDGSYWVAYGQELFNTLSNAETALLDGTLTFNEYPFQLGIVRRSFIIVQEGTTDLSNAAAASFFSDAKFRGQGISTSGGIPGINVPGGSNTNIQFNDNDVFGGSNDLTWNGAELSVNANMSVNGTFFVDIDSERVGIGITSPSAKLDVNGNMFITADSNNQSLRLYENIGGEYINLKLDLDGDLNFYADSGDTRLEIPDSNQQSNHAYRGIGVNALYHLYGEDYDTTMTFGDDVITLFAGGDNYLQLRNYDAGVGWQNFIAFNYLNNDVDFKWDSTGIDDAVFFEGSSGRVGIGTNNPISKLHVTGGNGVVIAGDFDSYGDLPETSLVFETSGDSVFVASHNGTERQKMEFHAKEYELETGESGNRNYFVMDTNGQIGIGTTSPTQKLDVDGSVNVSGSVYVPEISNVAGDLKIQPDVQGDVVLFGDTDVGNDEHGGEIRGWRLSPEGNDYWRIYITDTEKTMFHSSTDMTFQGQTAFTINSVDDNIFLKLGDSAGAKEVRIRDKLGNDVSTIDSDGNAWFDGDVGIGTTTPSQKLEIVSGNISLNANTSGGATRIYLGEFLSDGPIFSFGYDGTGTSPNNRLVAKGEYSSWTDELWTLKQDGTLYMKGDVGIGTTSPTSPLHINGTLSYGSLRISPTSDDGESTMGFFQDTATTDTNDAWVVGQGGWGHVSDFIFGNLNNDDGGDVRLLIQKDGNVGIGTTSPDYALHLSRTDEHSVLHVEANGSNHGEANLFFKTQSDPGWQIFMDDSNLSVLGEADRLGFYHYGSPALRMVLDGSSGNVGIGTTDPTQTLDVVGSIKSAFAYLFTDGSTQTSAQDGFLGHISTAIFKQNISTASQDTSPRDIHFKPDGTKVYISGVAGDGIVWEYDLSDPWNISSMIYDSNYFNVDSREGNPIGLFIRDDGEKMYISGSVADGVNEFDLGTAWDVTSADWVGLFNTASNETSPAGVEFRPDGKKMYIIGASSDAVNEYDLSTAWDVTTAVWNQKFGVDIDAPTGFRFKQDGTRMYVMDGGVEDDIHEYVLSTPWDISTAELERLFDVSGQNLVPQDIAFSPDMTKAYMLGSTNPASLFEYDLGISAKGKIIGTPLYFTCGENGDLAPGAEWSCGGNGEVNQYIYLWDDVTATGMALDCNIGTGTAVIRLETQAGGDTGCNITSTGENQATTFSCDIDSGNWFRPYTVSNGGHEECVVTMRFITR